MFSFQNMLIWVINVIGTVCCVTAESLKVKLIFDISPTALDPRTWSREDVTIFLRWVEREYDLPAIDASKFCMNGKRKVY